MYSRFFLALGLISLCNLPVFASNDDTVSLSTVDDFIESSQTPTYDCPHQDVVDKTIAYSELDGLNTQQAFQLTTMRTHAMICRGKGVEARAILEPLLDDEQADRAARYYVAAVYQVGFTHDMQENPKRCDYYLLARDSSKDKHPDIHLSASLGYIIECLSGEFERQVTDIYKLMQVVTEMQDSAALAHAHNRVALFYGGTSRYGLASKQYLLAYEAGKETYTDNNLQTILGSALVSLLAAQQHEKMPEVLEDYIALGKNGGTRRSKFVQYRIQAQFALETDNIDLFRQTMADWKALGEDRVDIVEIGFWRWYSAELCYLDGDLECLKDFVESEASQSETWKNYSNKNPEYLSLIARAQLVIGDTSNGLKSLERYTDRTNVIKKNILRNTNNMNIASLHQKIGNLQSEIDAQQKLKMRILIMAGTIAVGIIFALIWLLYRKHKQSQSIDSTTGLYNNSMVVEKLRNLAPPSSDRTNALAIFDIGNFTEMNLSLGADKGDFVIKQIANTFKNITRKSDILGRFGPEQFILCLTNIEEDAAQAFFERVKVALGNTFAELHNADSLSVDSSMSIYYCGEDFADINSILEHMLLSLQMKAANKAVTNA